MSTNAVPTEQLLALIAQGNRKAFDAFYHRYYDRVFRTAYYYLKDTEACREVVSDVFFLIWKMGGRLASVGNAESYLFIVARNEATRRMARDNETCRRHVSLSETTAAHDVGADSAADNLMELSELREALAEAVDALPEKCRIIFLMSREEGLDSRRIAEILGISDSTVRVQLKIAVEKIVARMKQIFPHLPLPAAMTWIFS